jgi:hypothetical protein
MLDHVFLTVRDDVERSILFYAAALNPLGINQRFDYDGKNGPPGHPDLKGFGANGRIFFWLQQGVVDCHAAHLALWPTVRIRSTLPMPPQSRREAKTMAHRLPDFTTIRATMPPTYWTLMATASSSFIRAGSTFMHSCWWMTSGTQKSACGQESPQHGKEIPDFKSVGYCLS